MSLIPSNLLESVIQDTFKAALPKTGTWNHPNENAFVFEFGLYRREGVEGYRQVQVALFAPMTYVQVWTRETWNEILEADLEYDEESGDSFPKAGKHYEQGKSEWELLANHDSCWREGLSLFFNKYASRLYILRSADRSTGTWYLIADACDLNLPDPK